MNEIEACALHVLISGEGNASRAKSAAVSQLWPPDDTHWRVERKAPASCDGELLRAAIKEAFGENKAQGRYIGVTRIPLICQNIDGIHSTLTDIKRMMTETLVTKERFNPVEKIVYGAVAFILTAVLGAVMVGLLRSVN